LPIKAVLPRAAILAEVAAVFATVLLGAITAIDPLAVAAITITLVLLALLGRLAVIWPEIAVVAIVPVAETVLLLVVAAVGSISALLSIATRVAILVALAVPIKPTFLAIVLPRVLLIRALLLWLVLACSALVTAAGLGCVRHSTWLRAATKINASSLGVLFGDFIAKLKPVAAHRAWGSILTFTRSLELLAIGHDDAVVVFCMLQIVFCQNPIAG
jgi:hypothetical protein